MAHSLLRSFISRRPAPTVRRLDGLVVVPCDGPDRDLCVLWDPQEEQIVEVLHRDEVALYADEDDLWHEARSGWDRAPEYAWAA
jgi:hypothetical protein